MPARTCHARSRIVSSVEFLLLVVGVDGYMYVQKGELVRLWYPRYDLPRLTTKYRKNMKYRPAMTTSESLV